MMDTNQSRGHTTCRRENRRSRRSLQTHTEDVSDEAERCSAYGVMLMRPYKRSSRGRATSERCADSSSGRIW